MTNQVYYTEVTESEMDSIKMEAVKNAVDISNCSHFSGKYLLLLPGGKRLMSVGAALFEKWIEDGEVFQQMTTGDFAAKVKTV